jgi:16S rRNA (adenine1518-N6/adenine1519-N6)-dimethyltransferase
VIHRAKKSLGQNFLIDPNLQRKIVAELALRPGDEVLEVGPGKGALTRHMVGRCRRLILVELDSALAEALDTQFGERAGVTVVTGNILDSHVSELSEDVEELKVVGNIPYNITTPILFHLLTRPRPREILLMVQKEVGDRILARPGGSEFGALTVGVQAAADAERVLKVPPSAFRPTPAVESVVIRIRPHHPPRLTAEEEEDLRDLTRSAFQKRRKQLQSILRARPDGPLSHRQIAALEAETGFDLRRRPETFSPSELILLSRCLRELTPHQARRESSFPTGDTRE